MNTFRRNAMSRPRLVLLLGGHRNDAVYNLHWLAVVHPKWERNRDSFSHISYSSSYGLSDMCEDVVVLLQECFEEENEN